MKCTWLHKSVRAAASADRALLVLGDAPIFCLYAGASAKHVCMVPTTRPVISTFEVQLPPTRVPDAGAPAKRAALAPGSFMKYMSEQSHSSGKRLTDVEAMAQARPT